MFVIEDELKKLPARPGVYIMHGEQDEIIYVGKAVSLKNRVRQYFQSSRNKTAKIEQMVSHIAWFEYILTDSELEALVLECNLIKEHRPRYNTMLKDDKTYPYIKATVGEDFPRLLFSRDMKKDGRSRYFGPYTSAGAVKDTLDLIHKLYRIRTCSRNLPKDTGKERPCLNYHIKQCMAPCSGKISPEEYEEALEEAVSFLKGSSTQIQKVLTEKMIQASENLQFEKAARYRDRIRAIQGLQENQKVVSIRYEEEDVIALVQSSIKCCAVVLQFRDYRLVDKEYFMLDEMGEFSEEALFSADEQKKNQAAEKVS